MGSGNCLVVFHNFFPFQPAFKLTKISLKFIFTPALSANYRYLRRPRTRRRECFLSRFFNLHNRLTTLICNIGIQILLTSSNAFLSLIAERIKFILVVNVLNCTVKFCLGKALLWNVPTARWRNLQREMVYVIFRLSIADSFPSVLKRMLLQTAEAITFLGSFTKLQFALRTSN